MVDKELLEKLKEEYKQECIKDKESGTYRYFLGWLKERNMPISYIEGMELGLLDFNNEVYNLCEADYPSNKLAENDKILLAAIGVKVAQEPHELQVSKFDSSIADTPPINTFRTYPKIYSVGHEENQNIFMIPEDEIVIEEKIDGANFRFMFKEGKVIFGSRTQELSEDKEHKFAKNFRRCIGFIQDKINSYVNAGGNLKDFEGMVFYGECCVPHTMQYDWEKIPPFLGFDINNTSNQDLPRRFLPYPLVKDVYKIFGLEFVPVIKVCKAKEISKIDDSQVPISVYAVASGVEDIRKAEGIVFKKYRFNENDKSDGQIMAKYVRDKFKEMNSTAFGGKGVKYNSEDDVGEIIFKYCTNARIDKIIFKLLDEGEKLDMELMHKLPKQVLDDIYNEHINEIFYSNYRIDFKKLRQKVPQRCAAVLKQMMINNSLK